MNQKNYGDQEQISKLWLNLYRKNNTSILPTKYLFPINNNNKKKLIVSSYISN